MNAVISFSKQNHLVLLGWLLVALNTLDGLLTYIGIKLHFIEEANPLLATLPPVALLGIKLLFSVALGFFLIKNQYSPFKRYIPYLLAFANLLYIGVTCLHVFWITLALKI